MRIGDGITLVPYLHGRLAFARHVRRLCTERRFDAIAVDLPEPFAPELYAAVDALPIVSLLLADRYGSPAYYIPTDPCDPTIEAIRQGRQRRLPVHLIGDPHLHEPAPLPPLPDEHAIERMGFDAYTALCAHAVGRNDSPHTERTALHAAHHILSLRPQHDSLLVLIHLRHFAGVVRWLSGERTAGYSPPACARLSVEPFVVNPDHLYFVLGELPFIAGKHEAERHNPFAPPVEIIDAIKDLFRETRDQYFDSPDDTLSLSPTRLQAGLTFVRNLTLMERRFIPTLFDLVAAAKGIGGNAYAVRILKSAKYYPYLPVELDEPVAGVGVDRVAVPGAGTPVRAVNLFRDTSLEWKRLSIRPDPTALRKKKYRFAWNPSGMCSHVPEDRRIESFNAHVRRKCLRIVCEDLVKTERFTSSVKDGIDIRQTLRNWYTGDVYVKEVPPSRGAVDTVVIIFDEHHDERYPHRGTWYAEHEEESTLTFYATDPFHDMIGPGIARSRYGGLSLLFPPRSVPDALAMPARPGLHTLAARLAFGAALFSREKAIAYVAARRPALALRLRVRALGKHLVWIPLSSFSAETLKRLRVFHVLNGKEVRGWAGRFIGE